MALNDELGNRMKENYEQIANNRLIRRCPVICRIDGKGFHKFTKGFQKPFDEILMESMQEMMKYLCENIQGCVLGYQQSDEISLLLIDYKTLNSQAYFDYKIQKVSSITASMATMRFNQIFREKIGDVKFLDRYEIVDNEVLQYWNKLRKACEKGAMFDSRCFNIPKEEVANYFYWRQLDATRNSVQMVGRANFSHKELQNKSCNEIQDMLMTQKNINWNDFSTPEKRGCCCIKTTKIIHGVERSKWEVDKNIPIFVNDGREYVERKLLC